MSQRVSDERLSVICEDAERWLTNYDGELYERGRMALDLRDCRAELAEAQRQIEKLDAVIAFMESGAGDYGAGF